MAPQVLLSSETFAELSSDAQVMSSFQKNDMKYVLRLWWESN